MISGRFLKDMTDSHSIDQEYQFNRISVCAILCVSVCECVCMCVCVSHDHYVGSKTIGENVCVCVCVHAHAHDMVVIL